MHIGYDPSGIAPMMNWKSRLGSLDACLPLTGGMKKFEDSGKTGIKEKEFSSSRSCHINMSTCRFQNYVCHDISATFRLSVKPDA
jgi:hypothetical protein